MSKITVKKKQNNFTILDNTCLRDDNLSWKAKGLLAYLLHLPDDWKFYLEDLKNRSKDGKDSTRSAINELIENKYIIRKEIREQGKFKGYDYTVLENPYTEKPTSEKPTSDNPTLLSTNKTKLLNKTNTNSIKPIVQKDLNVTFSQVWDSYNKKVGSKAKLEKKWYKLTNQERLDIMEYIPRYIKAWPDKAYRKNFETFLNNKSWEDEIIEKKGFTTKQQGFVPTEYTEDDKYSLEGMV